MTTIQLTMTEIMDILAGLELYADECDERPNTDYTGMRQHWAARAKRVRDLYERIVSADSVMLVQTGRKDRL